MASSSSLKGLVRYSVAPAASMSSDPSPWSPLRVRWYRALWIAGLVSNMIVSWIVPE